MYNTFIQICETDAYNYLPGKEHKPLCELIAWNPQKKPCQLIYPVELKGTERPKHLLIEYNPAEKDRQGHEEDRQHHEEDRQHCLTSRLSFPPAPTMKELVNFKRRNCTEEIGIHYRQFGILLLEDSTGAIVESIENKYPSAVEFINYDILKMWIQGKGLQPVTWKTLVCVLRDIRLNTLANDIADAKHLDDLDKICYNQPYLSR